MATTAPRQENAGNDSHPCDPSRHVRSSGRPGAAAAPERPKTPAAAKQLRLPRLRGDVPHLSGSRRRDAALPLQPLGQPVVEPRLRRAVPRRGDEGEELRGDAHSRRLQRNHVLQLRQRGRQLGHRRESARRPDARRRVEHRAPGDPRVRRRAGGAGTVRSHQGRRRQMRRRGPGGRRRGRPARRDGPRVRHAREQRGRRGPARRADRGGREGRRRRRAGPHGRGAGRGQDRRRRSRVKRRLPHARGPQVRRAQGRGGALPPRRRAPALDAVRRRPGERTTGGHRGRAEHRGPGRRGGHLVGRGGGDRRPLGDAARLVAGGARGAPGCE